MKIFRTAFWLGIVIYNLPSPASQPPAFEPQINGSRGLAAKSASELCPQSRESCSKNADAIPNAGDRGVHSSSPVHSHDTLTPTDRAVLWAGTGAAKCRAGDLAQLGIAGHGKCILVSERTRVNDSRIIESINAENDER